MLYRSIAGLASSISLLKIMVGVIHFTQPIHRNHKFHTYFQKDLELYELHGIQHDITCKLPCTFILSSLNSFKISKH